MDKATLDELERRGPDNIRTLISNPHGSGVGPMSEVLLGIGYIPNPTRREVEDWLAGKAVAAAELEKSRYLKTLQAANAANRWAKISAFTGVVAIVVSVLLQWWSGHGR